MELFELKYTEEIYELYSQIKSLLDHYLVEHNDFKSTDIYEIIEKHTEIIDDTQEESDEETVETELY